MSESAPREREPDHDGPHGEDIPGPATPGVMEKVGIVRRMYDWVLSFAERPGGEWALFLFAFAESSFFPIPPDPLLIALAIGAPKRAFRFAAICTAGSVVGGMVGYAIGWGLWAAVDQFFYAYVPGVTEAGFERVRVLYDRYDFWAIFTAGFTPIPYKLFTLSAGAFGIAFPVFIVASVVSRAARFFLVGALIYHYGPPIKGFIDRHFNKLAWLFLLLLVGGFVVIKLVLD